MPSPLLVNLGCGSTFHGEWANVDLVPRDPSVRQVDILRGLPFEDVSVDACYSSHVLEHLRNYDAKRFVAEQFRVLKKGGIIRVAVPDLEKICRNYLTELDSILSGKRSDTFAYEYTLLELFDQITRERPGGDLYEVIRNTGDLNEVNRKFLNSRLHRGSFETSPNVLSGASHHTISERVSAKLKRMRYRLADFALKILMGEGAVDSLRRGLFRDSGEVHHVMYDCLSLSRLLESLGFTNVRALQAGVSGIPNFSSYSLEIVDGAVIKPDSLYMEAIKP